LTTLESGVRSYAARVGVFRINSTTTDLCPEEWNPDMLQYVIWSEEIGEQGTFHFQGYVELKRKQRRQYLVNNFSGLEKAFITQRRGTQEQAIAYCSKKDDETFIAGPYEYGCKEEKTQGKRTDLDLFCDDVQAGMEYLALMLKYKSLFSRCLRFCQEFYSKFRPVTISITYQLSDFNVPPLKIKEKPYALIGESNCGKTSFAKAHFKSPLLVDHLDVLRDLNPTRHDGIIFDELTFSHLPHNTRVRLVEFDDPASIHVRYSVATIPARFPRIFCSNDLNMFGSPTDNPAQNMAILRRIEIIEIKQPLFDKQPEPGTPQPIVSNSILDLPDIYFTNRPIFRQK